MPCSEQRFWWNWWVNFAVAVATFLAAGVALFGQTFRAWAYRPKLSLTLKRPVGEKVQVQITPPDGNGRTRPGRYYHLRVSNARRWAPASQVQVMLLQLQEPAANGEFRPAWSGEIPLRWQH